MRSRNIKPGFFTNADLVELEPLARLLFIGLWCMADREGRLEDRPKFIKLQLLPVDNCDIDGLVWCLHRAGFVHRYVVENKGFIQVNKFLKHQCPHIKEAPSIIPAPDMHQTSTSQAALIPDCGLLIPDILIPDIPKAPVKKPAKQQQPKLTDEEWLQQLKESGEYAGIDLDPEIFRAQKWCEGKRRKCSRAFLLNWFKKIEKPVDLVTRGNREMAWHPILCKMVDKEAYGL